MGFARSTRGPSGERRPYLKKIGGILLVVISTAAMAGDPYLDALEAEAAKIGHVEVDDQQGPSTGEVGAGFAPNLSRDQFVSHMRSDHPGGNVLFVQLSPQERDKIYLDYYLKGASYQQVLTVMDTWLQSR